MPRAPILSREAFYTRLPNRGGLLMLEFNQVNTSLGAMIETVSIRSLGTENGASLSADGVDVYDAAVDKISELNIDEAYRLFNISGLGVSLNYAR